MHGAMCMARSSAAGCWRSTRRDNARTLQTWSMSASSRLVVIGAFIVGAATTVVRVQDGQQPSPIFKAKINVVRVDVSVTGRHDEPVADLQPSDFEVVEDGVLQVVETLQFVRLDGSRTSDL